MVRVNNSHLAAALNKYNRLAGTFSASEEGITFTPSKSFDPKVLQKMFFLDHTPAKEGKGYLLTNADIQVFAAHNKKTIETKIEELFAKSMDLAIAVETIDDPDAKQELQRINAQMDRLRDQLEVFKKREAE